MKRKIIRQKSAYTITLPVKWIREYNLEKAPDVDVTEQNNELVITAQKRAVASKVDLRLEKGIPDYYRTMIENQYLRGTDVLEISFADAGAIVTIQDVVSNLIGYEIVDQRKNWCRVSQTAMPTMDEVATIERRFFNVIAYGRDVLAQALHTETFNQMAVMDKFISDCRRYNLFCRRAIHKASAVSRTDEVFLDMLNERLVIAAYHHYYIYSKIIALQSNKRSEKGQKIRKSVLALFTLSASTFDMFMTMYNKQDMTLFSKINDAWQRIYFHDAQKLLAGCNEKEAIIISHAMAHAFEISLVAQPNTVLAGNLLTVKKI